jgi:hypothetical protein
MPLGTGRRRASPAAQAAARRPAVLTSRLALGATATLSRPHTVPPPVTASSKGKDSPASFICRRRLSRCGRSHANPGSRWGRACRPYARPSKDDKATCVHSCNTRHPRPANSGERSFSLTKRYSASIPAPGRSRAYLGSTTGGPQKAAEVRDRPSRQPWARFRHSRHSFARGTVASTSHSAQLSQARRNR